ncbi:MAG: hypothetical protein CSB15_00070 [Clostridiales bacterium]|nr:MAG: hypothetical protein CSB15_00070 [Clostridiales bacterium]
MKSSKKSILAKKILKTDPILMFSIFLIVAIGLVTIYDSTYYQSVVVFEKSPLSTFKKSFLYAMFGLGSMIVFSLIDYKLLVKKRFQQIWMFALFLMALLPFFGIGKGGDAKRWLPFFGIGNFMPSEIVKFAFILGMSVFILKYKESILDKKEFQTKKLWAFFAFIMLALILYGKDFSTTALLIVFVLCMLFIANIRLRGLFIISGVLAVFGSAYLFLIPKIFKSQAYRIGRLDVYLKTIFDKEFIYSDSRNQILNSIYAVSNGGITGQGVGNSVFKYDILPEASTDFIFAIFAETYGLLGSFLLLFLYGFIIYRIFKIAMVCKDPLGVYLAAGVGIFISLQVIVNIGVVLAVIPVTGIPLPFISVGGTSLIVMLSLVGIVLNIYSSNLQRR